ncbi:MAG: hypothetical protein GTN76_11375 [Candidatus Aenigmarchaeota archaeon]|nr:hypothetical protein [Candidatus Aenigmarchaeota archaeon]NIQ18029.1 hypothetical protein [Candidatus Aenigmarchaeota archaeon]
MKIDVKFMVCMVLFLLFLGLSSNSVYAVSIGISPADLYFSNVLKNGYAEKTIAVSTSSETPVKFTVAASGSIKDWIEFDPSEDLEVSKNSMKRITVIVKPPGNVANGVYGGSIVVSTEPSEPEGGIGVGVTTGAASGISVEITGEEIKRARVENVKVKDTEEDYPVEFSVSILNDGNVIITPLIQIEITGKGETNVLKSTSHSQTDILPTKMKIIRIKMDTDDLDIGEYAGDVKVFLDDEKLYEQTLSFHVFEKGTLSKMGVLQSVWNEPWVREGDVVKIDAYFENTGEVVVSGKFKGEVYLGNRLVEVIESDELEVPVGKTVVMSSYFNPETQGRYVVKGYVVYEGKTTGTKESVINVTPKEAILPPQDMNNIALLVSAIVVVLIIVILLKRRLKRGSR